MQELYFVAIVDCLGDVFGLDDSGILEVGDSLGDFNNLEIAAGGEGEFARGLLEDLLRLCSELTVLDGFV